MKKWPKVVVVATVLAFYVAFGWIVGLGVLLVATVVAVRRMIRARRALAPTTVCPWCHETLAQYGSFACQNCRARTLGWAWRCSVCGAWAGHLECAACGMSVTNPILGAP